MHPSIHSNTIYDSQDMEATDLEMIILSEVSQTEKDKYHMISLI